MSDKRKVHPNDKDSKPKTKDRPNSPTKETIATREMKSPDTKMPEVKSPDAKTPNNFRRKSITPSVDSDGEKNISGKEFVETPFIKFLAMSNTLVGLAIWVVLIVIFYDLSAENGFVVGIGHSSFEHAGAVLLAIIMNICHIYVLKGMSDSINCFIGYQLATASGYSIAACGFAQASFFEKFFFASRLSFKSPVKKFLSRAGLVWLVHFLSLIFAVLAATDIYENEMRQDSSTTTCIIFTQEGEQFDRGWPTIEVEMGVAEYLFGTSIGIMRSENDVANTTFVMSPQLIGAADQGSTLFGNGFIQTIFTHCSCSGSEKAEDLVIAGFDATVVDDAVELLNGLTRNPGLVNHLVFDESLEQVNITSIYSGTAVCGGYDIQDPPVPVCFTTFSDIYHGIIEMRYMTDGTPASIAAEKATIRSYGEKASMQWMHFAFQALFGGNVTAFALPSTFPGAVNPLMWWTTPNMQVSSASLLEEGFETAFAMLGKVAIQRSFGAKGGKCPTSVVVHEFIVFKITQNGLTHGIIFLSIQMIMIILSFVGYLPWVIAQFPISPALRFVNDKSFFTVMMSKPSVSRYINDITPNVEKDYMWPKMDIVLRVGESVATKNDPNEGALTIDKPKAVSNLSWTKAYN